MAALATPLTLRAALLTDRTAMRTLLTTKVSGVSPLDELIADYGGASDFTLADLQQRIQDAAMQVVVCLDKNAVMRGWALFSHHNPFRDVDGWEIVCIVTDKTLTLADRLVVFKRMVRAAATTLPATTVLWGDVKTPGNLDTSITNQGVFTLVATLSSHNATCHRWRGSAATVLANF